MGYGYGVDVVYYVKSVDVVWLHSVGAFANTVRSC